MSSSPSSPQWLSLVGAIWLQTFNGPNSDFPVYSSQLKDLKSISQVHLNFLAFASDAGKLFGWFSGIAAIYLPLWLVSAIGAAFGLIGYGVQFLFLDNTHLSYWHLFLLTVLAGNGICWINTVCYLICIKNFPSDSRVPVGLSTSYVGLSAKVYTVVADAFFHRKSGKYVVFQVLDSHNKAKMYLLLNAVMPVLITIIVSPFLRVVEITKSESPTQGGFSLMFLITLATGVCAVVSSVGSASGRLPSRQHMISLGLLLSAPWLLPAAMKFQESIRERWRAKESRVHDLTVYEVETGERTDAEAEAKDEEEGVEGGRSALKGSEDVGAVQMLRKLDFWLYFFSYMFSGTLGLVFLNNLGQIAESRGLADSSTLVSLSSSFGFFGRLTPSLLDYYSSKRGYVISRPASMAALMALTAGGFFLLLDPTNTPFLYISTAAIGACTGAITSMAVSITPELFGTKHFGVNHNIVVTNIPVGSFLFGYFAAFVYQREGGGSNSCQGTSCYGKTFIIWGSLCSFGTLLCVVLYIRTRRGHRKSDRLSSSNLRTIT